MGAYITCIIKYSKYYFQKILCSLFFFFFEACNFFLLTFWIVAFFALVFCFGVTVMWFCRWTMSRLKPDRMEPPYLPILPLYFKIEIFGNETDESRWDAFYLSFLELERSPDSCVNEKSKTRGLRNMCHVYKRIGPQATVELQTLTTSGL